jgi:hypothetical protein
VVRDGARRLPARAQRGRRLGRAPGRRRARAAVADRGLGRRVPGDSERARSQRGRAPRGARRGRAPHAPDVPELGRPRRRRRLRRRAARGAARRASARVSPFLFFRRARRSTGRRRSRTRTRPTRTLGGPSGGARCRRASRAFPGVPFRVRRPGDAARRRHAPTLAAYLGRPKPAPRAVSLDVDS